MNIKYYINRKLNNMRVNRGLNHNKKDKSFYRRQFKNLIISIVIVLVIMIMKKINVSVTNKAIDIVEKTVNYNVNIKEDSQRIWEYASGIISYPSKVISVFNNDNEMQESSTRYFLPAQGHIYQRFGEIEKSKDVTFFHKGVDIVVEKDEIVSMGSGEVIEVNSNGNDGKFVRIQHKDFISVYSHLDSIYVVEGQQISGGESIGLIKTNGKKYLHFEVWNEDSPVDPLTIIDANKNENSFVSM